MPKIFREKEIKDERVLGYILGLIAADGNLEKDRPQISFHLQEDDEKTANFVMKTVSLDKHTLNRQEAKPSLYRMSTFTRKAMVGFSLKLPNLYNECTSIGITPAKSLSLDPDFSKKSEDFLWYFLRGVIDGDGTIWEASTLGSSKISITARSLKFLEKLKKYYGGRVYSVLDKRDNKYTHCISWHGHCMVDLLTKLPMDNFCMERKTDSCKRVLKLPCGNRMAPPLSGILWSEEDRNKVMTPANYYDEYTGHKEVPKKLYMNRINKGWGVNRAISTPFTVSSPSIKEKLAAYEKLLSELEAKA